MVRVNYTTTRVKVSYITRVMATLTIKLELYTTRVGLFTLSYRVSEVNP